MENITDIEETKESKNARRKKLINFLTDEFSEMVFAKYGIGVSGQIDVRNECTILATQTAGFLEKFEAREVLEVKPK